MFFRPTHACFREELDREAAAELINRCELLSTSEVGLNLGHGKKGLLSRLVAPTATKGPPLVSVGGSNRD